MTKLTLSADRELVRKAKRLANVSGTSLSSMFARWVQAAVRDPGPLEELPPLTRKAIGMIQVPPEKSDRQLIEEALTEKYGS